LCHRGWRLRAHSPRARHRPRRPARQRRIEPPRLRSGRAAAVSRERGRDRRRHAPLSRPAQRARRRCVLHHQSRRAGSGARARCAAEPACRARYGDPARSYLSVRSALRTHAVPVTLPDPSTGEPTRFSFGSAHLATVLRLASYTAEYAALLPLLLDEAAAHQDYVPLAAQFLLIERGYGEALATGMHNSVVCAE